MRILGFVFLSLLAATGIVIADYFLPGTYLGNFLDEHFIETFAALVGFNIAAVVFLIGQLITLEARFNGELKNTRKEIKHNAYFLLSALLLALLCLVLRPDLNATDGSFVANRLYYIDNVLVLTIFILAVFAIYEILRAVFVLSKDSETLTSSS